MILHRFGTKHTELDNMKKSTDIDIRATVPAEIDRLLPFTFPYYRELWQTNPTAFMAFGAWCGECPVGLVLAEDDDDDRTARLLSINVSLWFRQQGIAGRLLQRIEGELARHFVSVRTVFSSAGTSTRAIQRLLSSHSWSDPCPRMLLIRSRRELLERMVWVNRDWRPRGFKIFPWCEATRQMLDQARSWEVSEDFPCELSPFQDEHLFDPVTSIGLTYRDDLAGWLVNHRLNADLLRFTTCWAQKQLIPLGATLILISQGVRRYLNADIPSATMGVQSSNRAMQYFFERRIAPFVESTEQSYESCKRLQA